MLKSLVSFFIAIAAPVELAPRPPPAAVEQRFDELFLLALWANKLTAYARRLLMANSIVQQPYTVINIQQCTR
jgi:hypothetical protein